MSKWIKEKPSVQVPVERTKSFRRFRRKGCKTVSAHELFSQGTRKEIDLDILRSRVEEIKSTDITREEIVEVMEGTDEQGGLKIGTVHLSGEEFRKTEILYVGIDPDRLLSGEAHENAIFQASDLAGTARE